MLFFSQIEGWDDFDERRRAKHQKQLDFRVMGSTEFDEGADKSWWLSFGLVDASCAKSLLRAGRFYLEVKKVNIWFNLLLCE